MKQSMLNSALISQNAKRAVLNYHFFQGLSTSSKTTQNITNDVWIERKYPSRPGSPPHSDFIGHSALTFGPFKVKSGILFREIEYIFPGVDADGFERTLCRTPLVAKDVVQGDVGDCWLLSAVAALAEHRPDLIEQLFTISGDGIVQVCLFLDGRPTRVEINQKLPCNRQNKLVFGYAKRNQTYVSLLEKAIAALYGSYKSLDGGESYEAFGLLTGSPSWRIVLDGHEGWWPQLYEFFKSDFPMVAVCATNRNSNTGISCEDIGLVAKHGYIVITLFTLPDHTKLIKLMNPYGNASWTGPWSDDWPDWPPQVRELLQPNESSNGRFWITFNDFLKFFSQISFCKIRDKQWKHFRFSGIMPRSGQDHHHNTTFEITVESDDTHLDMTMHQQNNKGPNRFGIPLLPIGFGLFEMKDMKVKLPGEFAGASIYNARELQYMDTQVCKGTFVIVIYSFYHWARPQMKSELKNKELPRYIMSIFGSKNIVVRPLSCQLEVVGDSLFEYLKNAPGTKRKCLDKRRKHNESTLYTYCYTRFWTGCLFGVENLSYVHSVRIILDYSSSQNLVSTRGLTKVSIDVIPPRHRQLLHVCSKVQVSNPDIHSPSHFHYKLDYSVENPGAPFHEPELGHTASIHRPRLITHI